MSVTSDASDSSRRSHCHHEPCLFLAPPPELERAGGERGTGVGADWMAGSARHGRRHPVWLPPDDSVVSSDGTDRHETNTVLATTIPTKLSEERLPSNRVFEHPFNPSSFQSHQDETKLSPSTTAISSKPTAINNTHEETFVDNNLSAAVLHRHVLWSSSRIGTVVTSHEENPARLTPSGTHSHSNLGGPLSIETLRDDAVLRAFSTTTPAAAARTTASLPASHLASGTIDATSVQRQYQTGRELSREMGYPSTSPHFESQDASSKMEGALSRENRVAEGKSLEGDDPLDGIGMYDSNRIAVLGSPVVVPLGTALAATLENTIGTGQSGMTVLGTPSTVSTAPSTDDASLGCEPLPIERLSLRIDDIPIQPASLFPRPRQSATERLQNAHEQNSAIHRRTHSWEACVGPDRRQQAAIGEMPRTGNNMIQSVAVAAPQQHGIEGSSHHHHTWIPPSSPMSTHALPPQAAPNAWAAPLGGLQRVASFRSDSGSDHATIKFSNAQQTQQNDSWRQHHTTTTELHATYRHSHSHPLQTDPRANPSFSSGLYATYQVTRKPAYGQPPMGPPNTPPRARNPRISTLSPHRPSQAPSQSLLASPNHSSTNPNRSSSEILKTLLRKKACLYEPDTSRAVALVTWLVGRELANEFGYFSRQQLQSGVHACVADMIDTGAITRTKVNRCMQIILNSCFHYIIPRPDGTEENGDVFRDRFAHTAANDSYLLRHLPHPWNDLKLDKEVILAACTRDDDVSVERKRGVSISPHSSPKLASMPGEVSSPSKENDGDIDSKRAVLLCFNENVRSAEDVFRCHNEFIRDTANASKLHLTAQEWLNFFGREAAVSPHLWGSVGIPVVTASNAASRHSDIIGRMSENDLCKFRTSWCAKRYDHDKDQCGFAHVDVNGGWLRRDPSIYRYKDELCPNISSMVDKRIGHQYFIINDCPRGVNCEFAHSQEEIDYHPQRYKTRPCQLILSRGTCPVASVCPCSHPSSESSVHSKRASDGRNLLTQRHGRQAHPPSGPGKGGTVLHVGAPMLYVNPAPVSSFDQCLGMPGLQSLFRRHCSVIRAHVGSTERRTCYYNLFGDDSRLGNPSVTEGRKSSSFTK